MTDSDVVKSCVKQFYDACRAAADGSDPARAIKPVEDAAERLRRLLRKPGLSPGTRAMARESLRHADAYLDEMRRVDSLGVVLSALFYVALFAAVVAGVVYLFRPS